MNVSRGVAWRCRGLVAQKWSSEAVVGETDGVICRARTRRPGMRASVLQWSALYRDQEVSWL